ncbi:MAG: DUF2157 domain-containing protein [Ferrovibrionaceae bacterium]
MLDRLTQRRVLRELPRWIAEGWIDEAGAAAIRDDFVRRVQGRDLVALLGLLGALLLGLGALLFVAAHWAALSAAARLTLAVAALAAAHCGAIVASRRRSAWMVEALLLLATLLFGANIWLIGQIFNLPPQPPAFFLIWMIASVATAWIWTSSAAALVAIAIGMAWMVETWASGSPHDFGFLAACALLAGAIARHGWVWAGQFLWLALAIAAAARLALWDWLLDLAPGHGLRLAVGALGMIAALAMRARRPYVLVAPLQIDTRVTLALLVAVTGWTAADFGPPPTGILLGITIGLALAALAVGWKTPIIAGSAGFLLISLAPLPAPWLIALAAAAFLAVLIMARRAEDRLDSWLGGLGLAGTLGYFVGAELLSLINRSVLLAAGGIALLAAGWIATRRRRTRA